MKRILLFASIIALLSVWSTNTFAADRATIAKYYSSLKGLKKEELKKALGTLLRQHKTLGYGKGKGNVWDAFYTTDRKENNEVVNRYSCCRNEHRAFVSQKLVGKNRKSC